MFIRTLITQTNYPNFSQGRQTSLLSLLRKSTREASMRRLHSQLGTLAEGNTPDNAPRVCLLCSRLCFLRAALAQQTCQKTYILSNALFPSEKSNKRSVDATLALSTRHFGRRKYACQRASRVSVALALVLFKSSTRATNMCKPYKKSVTHYDSL